MFDAKQAHEQLSRWTVLDAYREEPWTGGYQCFLGRTWDEALERLTEERSAIDAADGDLVAAHRARIEEEDGPGAKIDGYSCLDYGVIGLICALSAAGVCTISSASPPEGQPYVRLIADLGRLGVLDWLTGEVPGCRLLAGRGQVVLTGDTHDALFRLARRLIDEQASFDSCDSPREPGAVYENDDLDEDDPHNQLPLYPSWDSQQPLFSV